VVVFAMIVRHTELRGTRCLRSGRQATL